MLNTSMSQTSFTMKESLIPNEAFAKALDVLLGL